MALIRIYLAEQTQPNIGKWEIYREGKPTGEMVTATTIRILLTTEQYKQFTLGETFFKVPGERFRTRRHREPVAKKGRVYNNFNRKKNG